jgi:hypothetical protein
MVNFSRFVIRFSEWKSCPDVHPHEITSLEMAIKRFVFIIYKSDSNHFHCTHYLHAAILVPRVLESERENSLGARFTCSMCKNPGFCPLNYEIPILH